MKKNYLLYCSFVAVLISNLSYSQSIVSEQAVKIQQSQPKCGSAQLHNELMNSDPAYRSRTDAFNDYLRSGAYVEKSGTIYQVPVVVHVMTTGTSLTDITDDQIKSAIRGLNEMMRKVAGTPGAGSGVDVEIEYALAVRDPNGNCTSGIDRFDMTGNATYMASGVKNATGSGITDASLKSQIVWDQTKYYNIWLVSEIDNNNGGFGIQGYAFFASSHGTSSDGAVILANNFKDPYSSTAVHELGHSLNLFHTFEGDMDNGTCPVGNGCGSGIGDCCADTPPHRQSSSDCVVGTNPCDGNSSTNLFIHNYMDYSSEACQDMFTANQKTRMQAALTTTRASFLASSGNMALVPVSAPIADFSASSTILCGTGQSVSFYDLSSCVPNTYLTTSAWAGITFSWSVTNGTITYTSTSQNPVITFTQAGLFDVTLTVTDAQGSSAMTHQGMVVVSASPAAACTPGTTNAGNFGQTVNNVTFNTIQHSSSTSINEGYVNNTCTYNTVVASGGTYNLSVSVLSSGSGAEVFEAYIDYNNDGDFADAGELILSGSAANNNSNVVSGNITIPGTAVMNTLLRMRVIGEAGTIIASERTCGSNLFVGDVTDYGVYVSNKVASVTIAPAPGNTITYGTNTTFTATPVNGGASPTYQWYLNGSLVAGQTASAFSSTTLLDDDEVYCVMTSNLAGVMASPCTSNVVIMTVTGPPVSDFSSNVTMACTSSAVSFTDESVLVPTSWNWTFTGGVPATSSAQNPSVSYAAPGTYNVTLTASNGNGTGTTMTKTGYITVYSTPPSICSAFSRSSAPTAGIGITNVSLNTINNTTAFNDAVFNNFACSKMTSLAVSTNYSISVTVGSPNSQWVRVFIDYNNDGDFGDAGETVFSPANGTGARSGSFTTPASPVLDQLLRMRVITDFTNTSPGSCTTPLEFGQVEDYSVIFVTASCVAPTVSVHPSGSVVCAATNASFSVTASGTATLNYQWQEDNGGGFANISNGGVYSNATTSTLNLSAVPVGMNNNQYRCVITNGCGTVTSNAATLGVSSLATPTITPGGATTFCSGGSVTLTSSSATGNVWSPNGETTQAITVSATGNYSVTVTSGACSLSSAATSVTVNSNPATPTISAGGPTTFCSGGSVTLTSSAATGNVWSPNGETTQAITVSATGNYSVTKTSGGCSATSATTSVTVNPNPPTPTISAGGATTFCSGGSVTLTSSSASGNVWSPNGETTQSITASASGNYTVTLTSGGCSATSATTSVTVNPNPPTPTISAGGATTFCSGGSVTLTSSAASGNVWSPNGETTQSISASAAGNYSVTVTSGGCSAVSATTGVTVNPNPPMPTISAGGSTTICPGGNVSLSSSSATGNVWSPNGETTQSISASVAGNYSVTVTSGGCSTTSAATTVTQATNPVIASGTLSDPTVCSATDGSVQITGSGTGDISWTGTASGTSNGVNLPAVIGGLGAGTYNFTFNDGCASNTVSATINDPGVIPTISAGGPTTFCSGGSVTLTSSSATGNVWSPNGETTASITVSAAGNYSVTVTSGACVTTSTTTGITVNPLPAAPVVTFTLPLTFCAGGSTDLASSSAVNNVWSPNGETTQAITVTTSGVYSVTVVQNGCSSVASNQLTVTVNTDPTVTLGAFNPVCNTSSSFVLNQGSPAGGTYTVNGTLAVNFDPATATIGSNTIVYDFTDGNGCSGSATSNITVDDCTALPETNQGLFSIYPNPSNSGLTISGDRLSEVSRIVLYDEIGRIVQTYPVNANEVKLDLSAFANGVYSIKIKGASFEEIQKIQLIK